jgi:hypothetical protein
MRTRLAGRVPEGNRLSENRCGYATFNQDSVGGRRRWGRGLSEIRIGTSGWSYDHWNTVLYEPSLAPRERLLRYTQEFDTVELNASFYRWPQRQNFGCA